MPTGDFIEQIARQVKAEVRRRGQHANRYEPRPPDETNWPSPSWVSRRALCAKATDLPLFHDGKVFCRFCDALVRD